MASSSVSERSQKKEREAEALLRLGRKKNEKDRTRIVRRFFIFFSLAGRVFDLDLLNLPRLLSDFVFSLPVFDLHFYFRRSSLSLSLALSRSDGLILF